MLLMFQCAPVVEDNIVDGPATYKLPYPLYVDAKGMVQGSLAVHLRRIVGFQQDLNLNQIDVWWDDVVNDPYKSVGLYVVTEDTSGHFGVHPTALTSVQVFSENA